MKKVKKILLVSPALFYKKIQKITNFETSSANLKKTFS